MTPSGYRARVKDLGLIPCRDSNGVTTLHISRDKQLIQVPDPDILSSEERKDTLDLIERRLNFIK